MGILDAPPQAKTVRYTAGQIRGATNVESAVNQAMLRALLPAPSSVNQVMASPPTVGALATASAITTPQAWPSVKQSAVGSQFIGLDYFQYRCGGGPVIFGTVFPNLQYIKFTSLTTTNLNTAPYCVDFYFDGTQIEFQFKGVTGSCRLRVDGQLISATETLIANNGNTYFLPVTFATRAVRRISFEADGLPWGGVTTGPNDSITKAEVRGPRCIVLGDSFTGGANGIKMNQVWARTFGESMGWPDTWTSGAGGTGYLSPGSGAQVKFRDRLTADVLNFSPEIVIVQGGRNDYSAYTAAAIGAEATLLFNAITAALPKALILALSPMWQTGVGVYPANLLATRDAISTAVVAAGGYLIDLLQMPLGQTFADTSLAANVSANATTLSSNAVIGPQATIEIGSTLSTAERRVVTAVSGAGPYTITVSPGVTNGHSSGEIVRLVGPSFWTGSGRVGATTGTGNCDLYVSSDGIHPTQAGHDALGRIVAKLVTQKVLALN